MTAVLTGLLTHAQQRMRQATDEAARLMREILGQGPERTLRRGFVLVRDAQHQPVTSRAVADQHRRLSLEFHDGQKTVYSATEEQERGFRPEEF